MNENLQREYDIIVCGGGLSGIAAALAAKREGKDVLLIERYGFLGGHATNALVNPFMSYYEHPTKEEGWPPPKPCIANAGIFLSMVDMMAKYNGIGADLHLFDEEVMKYVMQMMVINSGVKLLFHTFLADVEVNDGRVTTIVCATKAGLQKFSAKAFVDCTGDADLTRYAGGEVKIGRDEDGLSQPMTMCFRLSHVDPNFDRQEMLNKFLAAKSRGEIKNPREDILMFSTLDPTVMHFNTTRVLGKSPMDIKSFTEGECEGREQVYEMHNFLKKGVKGFENSRLILTAPQLGVRESARIVGDYVLTVEDILNLTKFDDSIARSTYAVDIHNPSGTGTDCRSLPPHTHYTIPYRSLPVINLTNVIVAGRPISATHGAHSAIRILPVCTCIGEAAGIAAGLFSGDFHKINAKDIQGILSKNNGLY